MKQLSALLSRTKIQNVMELVSGHEEILTEPEDLDQDPELLNVGNGTIDLRTGELRGHRPEDLLTKATDVAYTPGAHHPDWDTALQAIPDEETREWIQVRFGQATTGHTPGNDQGVIILRGEGSNGKSTILRGIRTALGTHAGIVPKNAITAQRAEHPAELMTLRGMRFALIEELPSGVGLSVERVKDITGPEMTARAMRQDFVTWKTTHSLFISTNPRPPVKETDWGSWRRLAMVEFPLEYTDDPTKDYHRPKDLHLLQRLEDNTDGQHEAILAWLVAGAVRWYDNGRRFPTMPLTVKQTTQRWRSRSDQIGQFIEQYLEPAPGVAISSTELHRHFRSWQEERGVPRPWDEQAFSEHFGSHYWVRDHELNKSNGPIRNPVLSSQEQPEPHATKARVRVWQNVAYRAGDTQDRPLS